MGEAIQSMNLEILKNSRRQFFRTALLGLGSIAIGSFTVSIIGCSRSDPMSPESSEPTPGTQKKELKVDLTRPENQPLASVGGTLALGANVLDSKGILLYRASETSVKAYSRECTHQQCQVGAFQNGISSCPCHGSKYDLTGKNIAGPAPAPLHKYTAILNGNVVTITA